MSWRNLRVFPFFYRSAPKAKRLRALEFPAVTQGLSDMVQSRVAVLWRHVSHVPKDSRHVGNVPPQDGYLMVK